MGRTVFLVSLLVLYTSGSVETKSQPAWARERRPLDVPSVVLHGNLGSSYTPRISKRIDKTSSEEHLVDNEISSEEHLNDSNEDDLALGGGVYAGGCAHDNNRIRDIVRSMTLLPGVQKKTFSNKLSKKSKELIKALKSVTVVRKEATPVLGPNFRSEFETSNGIRQSIIGYEGKAGQANMRGLFSWPLSGGRAFFTYEADENGYRVESPQLPVAPEIPYPMPAHALQQIRFAQQQKFEGITFDLQGNPIYPKNWTPKRRESEGSIGQLADGSIGDSLTPGQWGQIWEPQV